MAADFFLGLVFQVNNLTQFILRLIFPAMKNLILFPLFFFLGADSFASSISISSLIAFSDKHAYQDNRKTVEAEHMYSASKGCCDLQRPYSVLEAYNGVSSFHQVALYCDQCATQEISQEQIDLCKSEFKSLHRELFSTELSEDLVRALKPLPVGHSSIISKEGSAEKIRVSSGLLKCDTRGGFRFRIDVFVK